MNRRAVTPIIEQFFIFAMGVFLFSMAVITFRGIERDYLDKTAGFSVQLAGEYLSLSIMNVHELASIGKNPAIRTTVTMPNSEKTRYYMEVKGPNITAAGGQKTAAVRIPAKTTAEGNAYTNLPFNIEYSGGKINLNSGRLD